MLKFLNFRKLFKYGKTKIYNMKQVKITLFFAVLLLFTISLVSSQGCADEGWKGVGKFGDNKTVCVTCTTCDYINFTMTNPEGNLSIINQEMFQSGSTFCYEFDGDDLQSIGTFQIDGYSQLDLPLGLCFDITPTGQRISVFAYIMSIFFIIFLFVGLVWINIKFNAKEREKLYKKIVIEYFRFSSSKDKGNLAYSILYLIAYGVLRMIFVLYYFIIILFIFIFTEMIMAFGINTFSVLMPQILRISLFGLIIVGVVFIAILYEVIKSLLLDIEKMMRGIE